MNTAVAVAVVISIGSALVAIWWAIWEIAATRRERMDVNASWRAIVAIEQEQTLPASMLPFAGLTPLDQITVWETFSFGGGHWRSPCAYSNGKTIDTISGIVIEDFTHWFRTPPPPEPTET